MAAPHTPCTIWKVPYRRNPFFTGCDEVLGRPHRELQQEHVTALSQPQGISGLGGIGKTQTALEYVYRYQTDYTAIFWVQASSTSTLTSEFVTVARMLGLPERDEQDERVIIEAVLHWLRQQAGWLLILDNVEDLAVVEPFVPKAGRGHILLTTRARSLGALAYRIEVQKMEPETGALFLLRRTSILPLQTSLDAAGSEERMMASKISQVLDGLPLALDQAGAYIKEVPCTLGEYLALYQMRRQEVLRVRSSFEEVYPASVATTWSLSFEKVMWANPAAAELLNLCTFLAPDAIPEEMITEGVQHLDSLLQPIVTNPVLFDQSIAALLAYSLVIRNTDDNVLSIHRLVQAVLRDAMTAETRAQWRQRAVLIIEAAFPEARFVRWPKCERLLSHALVALEQIEQEDQMQANIAKLSDRTGVYLLERARYSEAEPLLQQALQIREQTLGLAHLDVAMSMNNLARVYRAGGEYEKAEPLLLQALQIKEKLLEPEHPEIAQSLNNLGELYRTLAKYKEAELLHKRALQIREKVLRPMDPNIAQSLNNLAFVYRAGGEYERAEPLQRRALQIRKKVLGPEHPQTALSLNALAGLYRAQGNYQKAEPLLLETLKIREKVLGSEHPHVAQSLNTLAGFYRALTKYEKAEPLYQRALQIRKKVLGPGHPEVAQSLDGLATLYAELERYEEAEWLYQQSLGIKERKLGMKHWDVAQSLNGLAVLYVELGRYKEAEQLYRRSLDIWKKAPGVECSDITDSLDTLALWVLEKVLGQHPDVARSLSHLAKLYRAQKKDEQAKSLLQRALQIREKVLGFGHPNVAMNLVDLAALYSDQEKYEDAEPLYRRALMLYEQALGLEHCLVQELQKKYRQVQEVMRLKSRY